MDLLRKAQRNTGTGLKGAGRRDLLAEALEEERLAKAKQVPVTVVNYPEPADLRTWVDTDTQRPAYLRNGEIVPYTVEEIAEKKDTEFALGTKVHTFKGTLRPGTTVRDGPGSLHYATGEYFVGTFRNHNKCGPGMSLAPSGYSIEGHYLDDKPHGVCLEMYPGGDAYLGEFVGGLPHGFGVMYYQRNGSRYEGLFDAGEKHGKGTIFYENGDVFQGTWRRGQRHGYGITTYAETGRSYSADWTHDESSFRTTFVKDVPRPRSSAVPLDKVVSPLGIDLRNMTTMPDLVEELHTSVYRRLKMAFEDLDIDIAGEVDLQYLRSWWTQGVAPGSPALNNNASFGSSRGMGAMSFSETAGTMTSFGDNDVPNVALLHALQRASVNGVTLSLFELIGVMVPKLPEGDLRRAMTIDLTPETVLRLRGQLAGVNSKHADTFTTLCEVPPLPPGVTARQAGNNRGPPVVSLERLQVNRFQLGGLRVAHSAFVRAAATDSTPHGYVTFPQLIRQLYPQLAPGAAERFEVDTLPVTVLKMYARDFDRLDHLQQHHLGVERLKAAQRRWQHRRAVEAAAAKQGDGNSGVGAPGSPSAGMTDPLLAEGSIREGPWHHVAVWDVGDLALTVSLAKLVDRHRTGWVSLLDLLRFCYPNIPCLATKERLGFTVRAEDQCACVLCSYCGERYMRPRPPSPYLDGNATW